MLLLHCNGCGDCNKIMSSHQKEPHNALLLSAQCGGVGTDLNRKLGIQLLAFSASVSE